MKQAILLNDVEFDLPWGGKIVGKAGVTIRIDTTENVGLIGDYHCELDEDDYSVI